MGPLFNVLLDPVLSYSVLLFHKRDEVVNKKRKLSSTITVINARKHRTVFIFEFFLASCDSAVTRAYVFT